MTKVIFFLQKIKFYLSSSEPQQMKYRLYLLGALSLIILVSFNNKALSSTSNEAPPSSSENKNSSTTRKCPAVLSSWIEDDFTDKTAYTIPFKSEAKLCQDPVKTYTNPKPEELGAFLNKKFSKQVLTGYNTSGPVSDCNNNKDISREKAAAIQTRFYSSVSKMEAVNSAIVDEIAAIDSILSENPVQPTKTMLDDIDCQSSTFPLIRDKCKLYKDAAVNKACTPNIKKKRFEKLIKDTAATLSIIKKNEADFANCADKTNTKPGTMGTGYQTKIEKIASDKQIKKDCAEFAANIEDETNKLRWIPKDKLKEMANLPLDEKNNEKLKNKIFWHLAHNRDTYAATYRTNLRHVNCLTGNADRPQDCDFKEIRTNLQNLPELRDPTLWSDSKEDNIARSYFKAESCLLEKGSDRENSIAQLDYVVLGGGSLALGGLGFGLSSYFGGGALLLQSAGAFRTVTLTSRLLVLGRDTLNLAFTKALIDRAITKCKPETDKVINLASKTNIIAANVCATPDLDAAQARTAESDCINNALLTAVAAIPLAGPGSKAILGNAGKAKVVKEVKKDNSIAAFVADMINAQHATPKVALKPSEEPIKFGLAALTPAPLIMILHKYGSK